MIMITIFPTLQGFYLLQSLILTISLSELTAAHAKSVMILLFTRLSRSKTAKFVKSFLVFLNLFAGGKRA